MSRKVPNQSFEVFIFAIGRGKILENKNKTQNRRGRKKRLQILRWMQRKWTAQVGWDTPAQGLFPGARLLISKSTGLDDPCWSKGVRGDAYSKMPQQQYLSRLVQEWRYVLPAAWLSPPSELPTEKKRQWVHKDFVYKLSECRNHKTNCCYGTKKQHKNHKHSISCHSCGLRVN